MWSDADTLSGDDGKVDDVADNYAFCIVKTCLVLARIFVLCLRPLF